MMPAEGFRGARDNSVRLERVEFLRGVNVYYLDGFSFKEGVLGTFSGFNTKDSIRTLTTTLEARV